MRGGKRQRDWEPRRHGEDAADLQRLRSERARALVASARARAEAARPQPLCRPGVSTSTDIRYATTSAPQEWMSPDAAGAMISSLTAAAQDGADRIVYIWPSRLGGAFIPTAIALQQARASGMLAHAAFAYWPWRSSATWQARSILVNPADLLAAARRICTEVRSGAPWVNKALAHEDRALVELRLGELFKPNLGQDGDRIIVRSPNLLEMTSVFPPADIRGSHYVSNPDHILYRVRRHTRIGKLGMDSRILAAGDPVRAPFALFGLPAAPTSETLASYYHHRRIREHGLDAVLVDLTQLARQSLDDNWEAPFARLVISLDSLPGRRPPIVAIIEDAHVLRAVAKRLRAHNASLSPRRALAIEDGVYLTRRGTLGPAATLPFNLPSVVFEPDIKDASLAPLRRDLVALASALKAIGGSEATEPAARALRFLRRAASLPTGLSEAQEIADMLFPDDEEGDRALRSAFRPKMELAGLLAIGDRYPSVTQLGARLYREIESKVTAWSNETPVSAKLTAVLDSARNRASRVMIVVPNGAVRDVLILSDRAQRWDCEIVAPEELEARLLVRKPDRLIVVGSSPTVIRSLLTSAAIPERVALIGDVAGIGLMRSELRPVSRIEAFRPVAARAEALLSALARDGGDESLDLAEAEFRVRVARPEGEVDFTRSDEDYAGDIVHLVTSNDGRFAYRPGGHVLVQSASEIRPFVRRDARDVRVGDIILALGNRVREQLRQALSGSRRVQQALAVYHGYIAQVRPGLAGATVAEKARRIVAVMQRLDPAIPDSEEYNVRRWITADEGKSDPRGYRVPGAARDWRRFQLFGKAIGMPDLLADSYWRGVVQPTRAIPGPGGSWVQSARCAVCPRP